MAPAADSPEPRPIASDPAQGARACARRRSRARTQKDTPMPKNKKPRGGRPAANFEPRYGANKTSFHDRRAGGRDAGRDARDTRDSRDARGGRADAGERRTASAGFDRRPGSRSVGHRGYRPADEGGAPKQRWSSQERAGRDESRGIRNRAES